MSTEEPPAWVQIQGGDCTSQNRRPPVPCSSSAGSCSFIARVSVTDPCKGAWGQQMPMTVNGWLTLGLSPPSFPENGLYFGLSCPWEPHVLLWASEANMNRPWVRRLWPFFLVHSQAPISAQVIPVAQSPRDLISEPCDPQPEPGHGCVPSGTGQRPSLFLFFPRLAISLGTWHTQLRPRTGDRESIPVERVPLQLPSSRLSIWLLRELRGNPAP